MPSLAIALNTPLAVPPLPIFGTLIIDTTPIKGKVFIDGELYGVAPVTRSNIEPKSYTVSFGDVLGYATPQSQTVELVAGQITNVLGTYTAIIPPIISKLRPYLPYIILGGAGILVIAIILRRKKI